MTEDYPHRWLDHISGELEELYKAIDEGEHQQQDFKFRIDSSQKIAITLSAFANSAGGKLLIGVKDNGRIAGIDPEEEFYMVEGAATVYCKPPVPFHTKVYETEDEKKVLEVSIPSSNSKPHYARNQEGKWIAYIRQQDENFAANRVIIRYLKDTSPVSERKNLIAYGPEERILFDLLSQNEDITLSKFSKEARIPIYKAEKILSLFLKWEVIGFRASDTGIRFYLLP